MPKLSTGPGVAMLSSHRYACQDLLIATSASSTDHRKQNLWLACLKPHQRLRSHVYASLDIYIRFARIAKSWLEPSLLRLLPGAGLCPCLPCFAQQLEQAEMALECSHSQVYCVEQLPPFLGKHLNRHSASHMQDDVCSLELPSPTICNESQDDAPGEYEPNLSACCRS